MSMVKMTVEQCWDLGLWDKYCEWSGCNPYAINEGQIEKDTIIEFDSEFKKEDNQRLTYQIHHYDKNGENGHCEYLGTTIDKYQNDLLNLVSEIIENGRIINHITLKYFENVKNEPLL